MIERGPASESEVILAFLRAEVDSHRFATYVLPCIAQAAAQSGFSRSQLIEEADLRNEQQNAVRRAILQTYRGFGANTYLFSGFPDDITWRRVEMEPTDYPRLRFAREPNWIRFSDETRLVTLVAEKVANGELPPDPSAHIGAIQNALKEGKTFPELIAAESKEDTLILIEGHCRAAAYVGLAWKKNIPMFLGSSPSIHAWQLY